MTEPVNGVDVGQADYMKVFMQELTYQDPLKPIDNREFMAQMAQFSTLQQANASNENLDKLIRLHYGNRGLSLLGKEVKLAGEEGYGTVEAIRFNAEEMPEIRVRMDNGGEPWTGVDHIYEVDYSND
jgi:flagellar basal-body rod modification protein FlgD